MPTFPEYPDLTRITRQIQAGKAFDLGHASVLYKSLMSEIAEFEKGLKANEEIGAYLASFGREILVNIEAVWIS